MTGVVAAVDVGSNSVRLLVLDAQGQRVLREIVTTRLAQGVDATGHLDDEAISRTVRVIGDFRATWEANGVATNAMDVRIIATSAVRDAVDRDRFLAAVRATVGLDVDVLGGNDEAALAFAGATSAVAAPAPSVVIDVGGGSTELVVGDVDGSLIGSVSLQLGCVRLTERDLHSDPVMPAELAQARATIDRIVTAGLAELEVQGVALDGLRGAVGVAGTATTLAALYLGLDDYEESRIHGAVVPGDALTSLAAALAAMDVATRAALGPVQKGRAEVLHGGALVLSRTLELLGIDALHVSESDSLDAVAAGLLTRRRTR